MSEAEQGAGRAAVKWFNAARGYGFLMLEGETEDVFIHIEVLRACGLGALAPNDRVEIRYKRTRRGLVAIEARRA